MITERLPTTERLLAQGLIWQVELEFKYINNDINFDEGT